MKESLKKCSYIHREWNMSLEGYRDIAAAGPTHKGEWVLLEASAPTFKRKSWQVAVHSVSDIHRIWSNISR
jgi:hypothetical protein